MFWFFWSLFISFSSTAEFNLVPHLTHHQRQQALEILGLGSHTKNISLPTPLGTDSGLEVSLSFEFLNTRSIHNLIQDETSQHTLYYPKILIGKGIYDKLDFFIEFIPYTATFGISEFGGTLRYHFYQTENGWTFSGTIHGNNMNFNNQLISHNWGSDLLVGWSSSSLSFFTTIGWAQSNGKFIGGSQGVTESLRDENEQVGTLHTSLGVSTQISPVNIALSYDHYKESTYTIKLGLVF